MFACSAAEELKSHFREGIVELWITSGVAVELAEAIGLLVLPKCVKNVHGEAHLQQALLPDAKEMLE